ncbi:MAG: hypothetical protein AAFX76_08005, partial [Planctomycetota bacterium]
GDRWAISLCGWVKANWPSVSATRLKDYANTYADVDEIRERADRGMVSSDFLTRYACRTLGIDCEDFDEVRSRYRGWVAETDGQFAFTHPHKEMAQRSPAVHALRELLPEPVKVQAKAVRDTAWGLVAAARGPKPSKPARPAATPPAPTATASAGEAA